MLRRLPPLCTLQHDLPAAVSVHYVTGVLRGLGGGSARSSGIVRQVDRHLHQLPGILSRQRATRARTHKTHIERARVSETDKPFKGWWEGGMACCNIASISSHVNKSLQPKHNLIKTRERDAQGISVSHALTEHRPARLRVRGCTVDFLWGEKPTIGG